MLALLGIDLSEMQAWQHPPLIMNLQWLPCFWSPAWALQPGAIIRASVLLAAGCRRDPPPGLVSVQPVGAGTPQGQRLVLAGRGREQGVPGVSGTYSPIGSTALGFGQRPQTHHLL